MTKIYLCRIYEVGEFCRHVTAFTTEEKAKKWKKETQKWLKAKSRSSEGDARWEYIDQEADYEELELEE